MKAIRRFTVRPVLPEPLQPLSDLARNLRWSWHTETRQLFEAVDPDGWSAADGDPVRLLGAVSATRLAELAGDLPFLDRLSAAAADLDTYLSGDRWYQERDGQGAELPAAIGYFSPEFGVTAALPQYSGGLGILAGDHLKAASDLGVPLIGVGLLYRHGYFRQSLSRDGWQQEQYPVLDPNELPLTPLREDDGSPAQVVLTLPGRRSLRAGIWQAHVGRVPLLMLDSDVEENGPGERDVTDRLYGGGSEHRLLQEMLLGIGGVRAVRTYCRLTGHPEPEVFHTNEGHAGFLGLERIRELTGTGLGFEAALESVRAGTVFTTHTPVPAGIDRFDRELVARHFGDDGELPGLDAERVLALGLETYPGGRPNLFNMAVMGLRLAQRANGVSTLHGAVSREMFAGLWPGFDPDEVPITSVTNGVHAPTWVAPEVARLGAGAAGRSENALFAGSLDPEGDPPRWDAFAEIPDGDVWNVRKILRERLVLEVRERLRASWRLRGAQAAELGWIDGVLDPDILTIGFARRVPSYKRLTLMLRDRDRLRELLLHPERPVQIVVAGKAHPADDGGKRLIQELVRFADDPRVRHRIVFLPDYGMAMAQKLYPGCDVWLNNPLRPLEACGTSGMKAALNGCLNLSVLDGWWDEWFEPDFGWAIPTADGLAADENRRDELEANALYELIEDRVAPRFYDRGTGGLPDRWIEMVRRTLVTLGPKVLADRMVREYVERLYAPAAGAHRALDANTATELAAWKDRTRGRWPHVSVDHVEAVAATAAGGSAELGSTLSLRVRVGLGELRPDEVEVQAVAGRVSSDDTIVDALAVPLKPAGGPDMEGRWVYEGPLALDRTGPYGYTVRVLPAHPLLATSAELGLVALPTEATGEGAGVLLR
ncbi:alpha-glucan family phosphorylase [Streptomyces sp. AK02-01A]|uniref:alpha-glucan family phosphorylase n=1 Tax=Streptomyces sp. AK02-01A TaxID=3028648 RepID=UPI0029B24A1B|nr:alpha-glucan family phosphorylase [Streptomyces sp. AK02-01A]MDX3851820.1 alpha-glucan family phosphorylase [Streptomyces sp. AK02-01A]